MADNKKPPVEIYVFKDIKDAVSRLNKHAKNFNYPFDQQIQSREDIITYSVGNSVFRALGTKKNHHPSVVFRDWATCIFDDQLMMDLKKCKNQKSYNELIRKVTNGFLGTWRLKTGEKLGYGPASKIVNLLIKILQLSKQNRINGIIKYQHVPLDSFTLQPLKNIINDLSPVKYNINIPTNAAMSFVNTPELYNVLQESIFKLYAMLDGKFPPIYYDFYAWNDMH